MLIEELSGGKLRTCYEYKNRGTRGSLLLDGSTAFDNETRAGGDLLKLLGAFRDEAEKQGTFDFSAISSLISELSPPDCRSSTVLERDLSDALTLLSLPRAQVYIQSFSALPTSVLYGLQLRQAREAKGFELSVSMLTNLFKAGHRVAGTLLTEVEKLRVKPGQGGQRFTSDRKEFPTWENSVLL